MKLVSFSVMVLMPIVSALIDFPQLNHIKPKATPEQQAQAVKDLIGRLIKDRASEFNVIVDPSIGPNNKDTFQLRSTENGIEVTGTSGVAASMGFYYYLKYYCNGQRTWAGQQTELPPTLPVITTPIKITTNDRFRYYQNVCTVSYTMAFWQWPRWEQEIDWMAMQGINLPLAFTGQEAIFQRVYMSMGFTQADMDGFFGGPAFLAWARMGNIEGWGGPLPQMWITNKLVLQHQILDRMRLFGMIPVLPAFAGHVPSGITRIFPQAKVSRLGTWSNFNTTYSGTYLLDFQDPLFNKISKAFIETQANEFGTDHIYNADTFNEMTPTSSDPAYISNAGKAVYYGMLAGDPQAVWLMQGWLFYDSYWTPTLVQALVTSVPQGRMIVLDLDSENGPLYQRFESYYGQPFIWCMLHNFGGTMELYGAVDKINKGPFAGRQFPNSTMIGIGLTPEGIHQNEVIYEFMMENSWRTEPRDIDQWVTQYSRQRYGADSADAVVAWKLLMRSVYNVTDGRSDHDTAVISRRPTLNYTGQHSSVYNATSQIWDFDHVLITRRPTTNSDIHSNVWYNPEDLYKVWDAMLAASGDLAGSQLFHYDITDITRNCLQTVALKYYTDLNTGFNNKNVDAVKVAGASLVDLLADLDHLLSSNERFLLGTWIADARSWATDADESKLYEYNARNQITLWGPNGEICDYASKQWAGVTADFYKPRFDFFTQWLVQLIQNGTAWNGNVFSKAIMAQVEAPWTLQQYQYPTTPTGNPILISMYFHSKYRPMTKDPFFTKLWQESQVKKGGKYKNAYEWKMAKRSGKI